MHSELECQQKCDSYVFCVAFEYLLRSGLHRCEIHTEAITAIIETGLATAEVRLCKLKPASGLLPVGAKAPNPPSPPAFDPLALPAEGIWTTPSAKDRHGFCRTLHAEPAVVEWYDTIDSHNKCRRKCEKWNECLAYEFSVVPFKLRPPGLPIFRCKLFTDVVLYAAAANMKVYCFTKKTKPVAIEVASTEPPCIDLVQPGATLAGVCSHLRNVDLSHKDLSHVIFNGVDLRGARLAHAILAGASFQLADVRNVQFDHATMTDTNFQYSDIRRASFRGATLDRTDFTSAAIDFTDFTDAHMHNVIMTNFGDGGNAGYTTFDGADLTGSQITDSSLPGVSFRGAILKDLAVEDSYFSDGDFTGAVFKGIRFRDGSVEHANFENADLGEGNFEACVFEEANLRGANLRRAILTETNMQNANCYGAAFDGSSLNLADLRGADLRSATFQETKIVDSTFGGANVDQADFTNAIGLLKANFYEVKGMPIGVEPCVETECTAEFHANIRTDPACATLKPEENLRIGCSAAYCCKRITDPAQCGNSFETDVYPPTRSLVSICEWDAIKKCLSGPHLMCPKVTGVAEYTATVP
uniref:Uncharacterized protein n=2 Tax=Chrysotila carterae TaxID=13221 RepID=A0A7S4EWJ8_CHRCT